MEFDFSRSSPHLFAATVASSTLGGRISPDCPCHVICLACALALPSPCFSTLVSFAWALELEMAGEVACVISGCWATAPTPRPRVEEARSAGSSASPRLWAQDSWASRATAARAASETVESLASGRRSRCTSLWSHQGAGPRRGARVAFFFRTQCGLEGFAFQRSGSGWLRDF